jgi:PAS domain S-box-containing protein
MQADPPTATAQSEPIRILLVEDDNGCAVLVQAILTRVRYGAYKFRRAENLAAALQVVAQGEIDIILLDLGLPDSQGLDTFVRMHAAAAAVPIVVLSGLDDESLATTAVSQGAQDYIVKGSPDGAVLARAIRYALERCRAQQALVAEHDLLLSVINNIPDQVYVKDTESRFVAVNPVTARFFGAAAPAELVGKSDVDYFPRGLAEQFLAEERALFLDNQPCVNRETVIRDSDGNTRWVLTTKVPLRDGDGQTTGLLGINRDITERKEAEEAIRRANAELEQRVTERTSALREAVVRLEEVDRARVEFVANVSHELKTPLTALQYGITNLLEGVTGPVSAGVNEYLQMLHATCQRLAGTVEDILDLSRLESKTMRLHRVKLLFDRLIQKGVTALSAQAQAKRIEMVLSLGRGLGFVEGDAFKTVRALINIIGNAIKYTPDGGRVEITLHRETAAPGVLVVDVTDNGIGIAPQHLGRVSEKYFRVGEYVSGAGLGLSIAKEIVELHGGQLAIRSPPPERERGTRVSISMPAVPPPTILIASTDESIRALLEQQLRAHGYHVSACASGEAALDFARRAKPDVCIFEVSTSAVAGEDLVFRLKADEALRAMRIVAATDSNVSWGKQEILNGLGIPLLPKPWREEDLLDRLETAMGGRAAFNGTTI